MKYYSNDKIKDGKTVEACSTHEGVEKRIPCFGLKTWRKQTTRKT